jgi:hypothetical protein
MWSGPAPCFHDGSADVPSLDEPRSEMSRLVRRLSWRAVCGRGDREFKRPYVSRGTSRVRLTAPFQSRWARSRAVLHDEGPPVDENDAALLRLNRQTGS